jgi:hypothetical protein
VYCWAPRSLLADHWHKLRAIGSVFPYSFLRSRTYNGSLPNVGLNHPAKGKYPGSWKDVVDRVGVTMTLTFC